MFLLVYEVPESLVKPILLVSMLASGGLRALAMVPKILLYNNSHPERDKMALNLFQVYFLGDVVAIVLISWLIKAGVQENYAFLVFVGLYLLASLFQQFAVNEGHIIQNQPAMEYIRESLSNFRVFFAEKEKLLWFIDNLFITNFYVSVMMWIPYYFSKLGFESETALMSLMFPLATCLAIVLFSFSLGFLESRAPLLLVIFFAFIIGLEVCMLFLGTDKVALVGHALCFGAMGLLIGPGYSWIFGY